MNCTACSGELEDGFIPDAGHAQIWAAVWVAGTATANEGFMNRLRTGGGVNVSGVVARAIDARRCRDCGRLELYATRPVDEGTTPVR
jgi:hypothetical protein